jgi:hypothetical protein
MNLLEMERRDIQLARALGIRARQENHGADSVLVNEEIRKLCKGRDYRGIKMLVGAFLAGWTVQSKLEAK